METEICVPVLGESVVEATVGKWLKKIGDEVLADEPVVELETDKVAIEASASVSGILAEIIARSGETVRVGARLGLIRSVKQTGAKKSENSAILSELKPPLPAHEKNSDDPLRKTSMPPAPSAARLMEDKQITSDQIQGSGKRGQILKTDVLQKMARNETSLVSASDLDPLKYSVEHERVPMSRLRQTIAKRLKDAQNTAAMLTTFNEVDMKPIMDLRARYKDAFEKKHGVKLGFMGIFTRAATIALQEIPALNAEIDGSDIVYRKCVHVAVAVSTEQGLVVPVVRDTHQKSLADIEKGIVRLSKAARNRQLSVSDMQGGTFTISNGGVYGSLMSTPILNMPQSGILGMHKIQDRPIALDGQIVIRPMMYLALSYDHRIVDGREAVLFLVRLKEILEDPVRLSFDL